MGCCTFRLPHAIMALLDVDGDGKLTWEDQKLLFGSLRTVLAQQARPLVKVGLGSFRKSLSFISRGYDQVHKSNCERRGSATAES